LAKQDYPGLQVRWESFTLYIARTGPRGLYGLLGTVVPTCGQTGYPFSPLEAAVFSLTSFHGRGFFPGGLSLDDPVTVLAALEAVIGLFIEISFIATFTQRCFGAR
jgi:hypothetical protein